GCRLGARSSRERGTDGERHLDPRRPPDPGRHRDDLPGSALVAAHPPSGHRRRLVDRLRTGRRPPPGRPLRTESCRATCRLRCRKPCSSTSTTRWSCRTGVATPRSCPRGWVSRPGPSPTLTVGYARLATGVV